MLAESRRVLDSLGIRIPRFGAEIEKLSGGQRQAVAIARAVYWKARLMIMDEPTNNLGVPEQRKVLDAHSHAAGPGRAGDPHLPHPAGRVRGHRPDRDHAPGPQGRRDRPTASTNSQEVVEYMVGARNDFPVAPAA